MNIGNNVEVDKELTGHTSIVSAVEVAPNNEYFISSSNDKTIRKWDLATLQSEVLIESDSKVNSMAISPDSRYISYATQNGKTTVVDLNNRENLREINNDGGVAVTCVKFNSSGNWMSIGDSKGKIKILNTAGYQVVDELEGHKSRIYDIDFNTTDRIMATSSLDGTVRMWDCTDLNNQPIDLTDHESWVLSIAFSPDDQWLVTSSNQKDRILVWPASSEFIADNIKEQIKRNMTQEEWEVYVAKDVEYEKFVNELNN